MGRILGAVCLATLALGGMAQAADLPAPVYKAPVAAPVPYDWTGFYLGGNGGYSWGKADSSYTLVPFALTTASTTMNGWVAGGQAGYNWQVKNFVLGLEADIQATGQDGTFGFSTAPVCARVIFGAVQAACQTATGSVEDKLPWFGTFRGRLGVTPTDRALLYVTGGLAVGQVDTNFTLTRTSTGLGVPIAPLIIATSATTTASATATRVGWTVGAGGEWAFWGNWSVKLEYLYVDLGTVSDTFTGLGAFTTLATSSHVTDNIARVGLNYRFGAPPVVVATR